MGNTTVSAGWPDGTRSGQVMPLHAPRVEGLAQSRAATSSTLHWCRARHLLGDGRLEHGIIDAAEKDGFHKPHDLASQPGIQQRAADPENHSAPTASERASPAATSE